MMESKQEIRKRILDLRNNIEPSDRKYMDGRLYKRLTSNQVFLNAQCILCYVSFRSEVDTYRILNFCFENAKRVAVPRVCGDEICFYEVHSLDDLVPGYMGIPEPKDNCPEYITNGGEIILVPGTVFDKRLYRIGYGGGFYDRYLSKVKKIKAIGLAYDFQVLDEIPIDSWDKGLNMIITDMGVYSY